MIVKCICTNCSGHLEFEEENAGQQIKCPHCGWDTILGDKSDGAAEASEGFVGTLRKHRRAVITVGGSIVVLGIICFGIYRWGIPWIQDTFPWFESPITAALAAVAALWIAFAALVWTAFPIMVCLQLARVGATLKRFEEHSSPALLVGEEVQASVATEPLEEDKGSKAEAASAESAEEITS